MLLQLYTQAILKDETKAEYFINRAHALQKLERYADSKEDSEKAIKLNPADPKAHLRKGIACFHLGLYEEAHKSFLASSKTGGNQNFDIKILFYKLNEDVKEVMLGSSSG